MPSIGIATSAAIASGLWFLTAGERRGIRRVLFGVCLRVARIPLDRFLRGVRRRRIEVAVPEALRALADSVDGGELIVEAAFRIGSTGSAGGRQLGSFARDCMRGSSVSNALSRLTALPNGDLWIPMAFVIGMHARCGGDLAVSLRSVAAASEAAQRSRAEARAGTAQARFTGNLVCALPLFAILVAALLMPERLERTLQNPVSVGLLICALLLQALSLLVIRRLAGGGPA